MFRIVKKTTLNPTVVKILIDAPLIASKAKPGQFVILRTFADSERIPLTISDSDPKFGMITLIYQVVGASTMELNSLDEGDSLCDLVGPLGAPTELDGVHKAAVVGGGVGCAIAYPIAKQLQKNGCDVHSVIGFRNKDLVILEEQFRAVSNRLEMMTDDGSYGQKGLVTQALEALIKEGNIYDTVFVIGPLMMMKFVCEVTRPYGIKTIVSMNPIMIDGTGMCGGCRLTVGGETKFACVDGPDFDGHLVDFDEAIKRSAMYRGFETKKREDACNLLKKEVE